MLFRRVILRTALAAGLAFFLTISVAFAEEKPAAKSEAPAFTRTEDVIYGRKDGVALTMDIFSPSKPNGAAVIFIVSGGYRSAHSSISPAFLKPFLDKGYKVFAVVHGSQPRYQVPEIIGDIKRATRFIRHHAKEYGIDPERFGVTGASAGGNLSLLMGTAGDPANSKAADPVDRESSKVQAVACLFPPTDFLNYGAPGKAYIHASDYNPAFRASFDYREMSNGLSERITDEAKLKEIAKSISPVYHCTSASAPTLIIHGDKDTLVPLQQSEVMIEKLKSCGVKCELIVKKGGGHGVWLGMDKDLGKFADWFDQNLSKNVGGQ